MSTNKSRIYLILALSAVFAVGFALLRTVLVINYYDVNEGLYSESGAGVTAARAIFAASLLLTGALSFFTVKNADFKKLPESGHGVVFTGALCGFLFISSVILVCYYFLPSQFKSAFDPNSTGALLSLQSVMNGSSTKTAFALLIMLVFTLVFGLLSSLYYFWCASTTTKLSKLNYKLLSLMPVLWGVSYLIYMYFKKDTVINSPERLMAQLSAIAVMLYSVAEARFHFGIAKLKWYVAISCVSLVTVVTACVPSFLLTAFWLLPFGTETVFGVLQIGIAAYIVLRLISVAGSKEAVSE